MIFLLEIMTSRSRLLLVNVMERDKGGGGQKREFLRDVIIAP